MATRKTGSRRIVVDGVPYQWRIRKRATYSQADYGGCLRVAVQLAEERGSVLLIITDRSHPQSWVRTEPLAPVLPSDIANWIRSALQVGWAPRKGGSPFPVRAKGTSVQKLGASRSTN